MGLSLTKTNHFWVPPFMETPIYRCFSAVPWFSHYLISRRFSQPSIYRWLLGGSSHLVTRLYYASSNLNYKWTNRTSPIRDITLGFMASSPARFVTMTASSGGSHADLEVFAEGPRGQRSPRDWGLSRNTNQWEVIENGGFHSHGIPPIYGGFMVVNDG